MTKIMIGETSVVLKPGDEILWQGRPEQGVLITRGRLIFTAIGLTLIVLGLWLMLTVRMSGPILGLPLLLYGLYMGVWQWISDKKRRAKTYYAITTTRALIVYHPRAMAYQILPKSPIKLIKGKYDRVLFASERVIGVQLGSHRRWVAFRDLADGQEPYDILKQIQARVGAG